MYFAKRRARHCRQRVNIYPCGLLLNHAQMPNDSSDVQKAFTPYFNGSGRVYSFASEFLEGAKPA